MTLETEIKTDLTKYNNNHKRTPVGYNESRENMQVLECCV